MPVQKILNISSNKLYLCILIAIAFGTIDSLALSYLKALGFPNLTAHYITMEYIRELACVILIVGIAMFGVKKISERIIIFFWIFAWSYIFYYISFFVVHPTTSLLDYDLVSILPQPMYLPIWSSILIALLIIVGVLFLNKSKPVK